MPKHLFAWLFLSVLFLVSVSDQCSANDTIRFRVVSPQIATRTFSSWAISAKTHTFRAGDSIQYDVYLTSKTPGIGSLTILVDGIPTDGSAGWTDQNGIPLATHQDISHHAYLTWYRRTIPIPASVVGKTALRWNIVADGVYGDKTVVSAMFDNIKVVNDSQPEKVIYDDGQPDLRVVDSAYGQSSHDVFAGPLPLPSQSSTFFFYWYHAPDNNANAIYMPHVPYGLKNDPWIGYNNSYYSVFNPAWWEQEMQDVRKAGITNIALISWGNRNWYRNETTVRDYLVPVLKRAAPGVRIMLFDDTTSERGEWNVDNGRAYGADTVMPLSNQANWTYFYDRKIKPFFDVIPKELWATHNQQPLEQGGRPVIITYGCNFFSDVGTHGSALWTWIKQRFAADFKDANGAGITPFVIHDSSWFVTGGADPADGRYSWGATMSYGNTYTINGNRVSNIGAGYDESRIRSEARMADRFNSGRLVDSFAGTKPYQSLIGFWETWNEFWEGTSIQRCRNYDAMDGSVLPETYYMDIARQSIVSSIGLKDWDATFLRTWENFGHNQPGGPVYVKVRNDGMQVWKSGEVNIIMRLLDPVSGQPVSGLASTSVPGHKDVRSGEELQTELIIPSEWPASGSFDLQFEVVVNGQPLSVYGDQPMLSSVILGATDTQAPSPVASLSVVGNPVKPKLRLTTSADADFHGCLVRRYDIGQSVTPASGQFVAYIKSVRNQTLEFELEDLIPLQPALFAVYSVDNNGNISSAQSIEVTQTQDTVAPGTVSDLRVAVESYKSLRLQWTCPPDSDLEIVEVRTSTTGFPQTVSDGSLLARYHLTPGCESGVVHDYLAPGLDYFYTVFAVDESGNASTGQMAMLHLPEINPGNSKLVPEGTFLQMEGLVVVAVFADEGAIYVRSADRSSAIRVSASTAGLSPGDLVSVTGQATAYRPGGAIAVERMVTGTVVKTGVGPQPLPVRMQCDDIGGESIPPNVLGVDKGLGLNNIGQLVSITGHVRHVVGNYIYIDDGSNVQDINGRTGVMVLAGPGHGMAVGNLVKATGIVKGSVPVGWTLNRRFIRTRSLTDIVKL